ncbi:MAG: DUF1810 domain-containing protein [Acidobacteriota bacterium]|nr:DUF1810 domain-containing protein [Acidobacteriota bacterium]
MRGAGQSSDTRSGIDRYRLRRFVDAQSGVYAEVLAELTAGRKMSHWMWFIFPQIAGLGVSSMAQRFALSGVDEASSYLAHPMLGARLRECTSLVNACPSDRSVDGIFGYPDSLKFHSCMTLFARAVPEAQEFQTALRRFFHGRLDPNTLARLQEHTAAP